MWFTTSIVSLFVATVVADDCNWGYYDYFLFAEGGCSSYSYKWFNYSWAFYCPENDGENGTLCMYWGSTNCNSQWYNCSEVGTYYCDGSSCDGGVSLECNDYYNSSECSGYKDKAAIYQLAEVDACVPYYYDYSISYDVSEDGIFARKWYSTNCTGWSYSLFNYTDGCVDNSYEWYYNYSNGSGGEWYSYTKSVEYIFGEWGTDDSDSNDTDSSDSDSSDSDTSDSGGSSDDAFKLIGHNSFLLTAGATIFALTRN